jgi:hypothetical protein
MLQLGSLTTLASGADDGKPARRTVWAAPRPPIPVQELDIRARLPNPDRAAIKGVKRSPREVPTHRAVAATGVVLKILPERDGDPAQARNGSMLWYTR